MINHAIPFISLILHAHASTVEVKRDAEVAYTAELQSALKNTVWLSGGCSSWYTMDNGWNSTVYPYTQVDFWRRCAFPNWSHWDVQWTAKGIAKRRWTRTVRGLAVVLAIGGLWRWRQSGMSVRGLVGGLVKWVGEVRRDVGL
jgi:hypothetical protein